MKKLIGIILLSLMSTSVFAVQVSCYTANGTLIYSINKDNLDATLYEHYTEINEINPKTTARTHIANITSAAACVIEKN